MAFSFQGAHCPQEIMLMGVRWSVAYLLRYRHVEALLEERGVPLDHAPGPRWVVTYSPLLEDAFHRRKRPGWVSWHMDETDMQGKGEGRSRARRRGSTGSHHCLAVDGTPGRAGGQTFPDQGAPPPRRAR